MSEYTTVGKVQDFQSEAMQLFQIGENEVIVVLADGEFHAFDSKCPHAYQPLIEGDVHGKTITCAYHRIVYRLPTGEVAFGSSAPLRLFEVRVEGDEVQVGPRKAVAARRWGT